MKIVKAGERKKEAAILCEACGGVFVLEADDIDKLPTSGPPGHKVFTVTCPTQACGDRIKFQQEEWEAVLARGGTNAGLVAVRQAAEAQQG